MSGAIRVPLIEPGTVPELAQLEDRIRAERGGEIAVLYRALLNSPAVAAGWEGMLTAIRNRTLTPANQRELIILRIAVLNNASFEFAAHAPHARAAGVSDDQIDAVGEWTEHPDLFDDDERLVLQLTDAMTREIAVPDALMQSVQARFTAQGVVEVTATVAAYNMVSRFLVALNITH